MIPIPDLSTRPALERACQELALGLALDALDNLIDEMRDELVYPLGIDEVPHGVQVPIDEFYSDIVELTRDEVTRLYDMLLPIHE